MGRLLILCCYFICNSVLFAQKYTVLLSTLQKKCFNSFLHSAVDARRQSDGNPTNIKASSQQLLRLSDHGSEPTHCNEVLHWRKTHAAINGKLFKKLDHVNNSLYEVELPKAQIEHKEPIIVGFSIPQYAKLRMLELYYNFLTKFCDVN